MMEHLLILRGIYASTMRACKRWGVAIRGGGSIFLGGVGGGGL